MCPFKNVIEGPLHTLSHLSRMLRLSTLHLANSPLRFSLNLNVLSRGKPSLAKVWDRRLGSVLPDAAVAVLRLVISRL